MTKAEKLGKWLEKAQTAKKKDDKLNIQIKRVSDLEEVEFVKTGITLLDEMVGGFPRGRFSLVFGGPQTGKSTMMSQAIGHIIKNGGSAMIFEPENRAEKKWMMKFMDGDSVYISQATGLGDALDSLVKVVESGLLDIVFVDSLASLAVKELKAKGTEGDHMALVARRLPQFFQMATEPVADTKTAVVFIHQMRSVLEMYSSELETYNGGNALKHWVSLVLNIRRASAAKDADKGDRFKDGTKKLGYMANVKCIKGGLGTIKEQEAIQLDFMQGKGFMNTASVLHFALRNKIISKDRAKYYFSDSQGSYEQTGLGNVERDLESSPELVSRILEMTRKTLQDDSFVPEDIAPDLEFEEEMTKGLGKAEENTDVEPKAEATQEATTEEQAK